MSGLLIMLITIVVLSLAYLTYGRWLANKWGIDPKAKTPAYEFEDGVDFVPTDKSVIFGHQFASIAGAGPINGPIQAAVFGWIPVFLWCLLGGIFFGAVQDFSAMYVSVKSKGQSMGVIIEEYIGKIGKKIFLIFCWLFCILVIAAFADIVSKTFNGFTPAGSAILANASVASTTIYMILFAVLLGIFLKKTKFNAMINTVVAIALLIGSIALGLLTPIYYSLSVWHITIFIYIFIASVLPVWLLLQPRDYLNSYLLVVMIAVSVFGIIIYNPDINLAGFTSFNVDGALLFPTLFVTVACGAISGFHALVSSGTSSKQIKNEQDMLPVSFGAMLLEVMLAIISLICVGFLAAKVALPEGTPPQIFADAISIFLAKVGVPKTASSTLILLAISAFGLTSLDSVARIGRLSFQELFIDTRRTTDDQLMYVRILSNKYLATTLTLVLAYILAKIGYKNIWPLFGSANQLLAALALLVCALFLRHTNRGGAALWLPMASMLAITFTALSIKIYQLVASFFNATTTKMSIAGNSVQLVFALLLFALGLTIAFMGIKKLAQKPVSANV